MSEWQPIETAPKDGTEIIVGNDQATVWITRGSWWSDGEHWATQGYDKQEEAAGWWSYANSVGQDKLNDYRQPTHWLPMPTPPQKGI
jgi:hypothetical protein